MDNRTSNNDEAWVEERIARLSPPAGWKPDADRALERLRRQHGSSRSMPRALRLSLAGATVGVIGVVVALLPWPMLWTPKPAEQAATNELIKPSQQSVEQGGSTNLPDPLPAPAAQHVERVPGESPQNPAQAGGEPNSTKSPTAEPAWPPRQRKNYSPLFASVEEPRPEAVPRFVFAASAEGSAEPLQPTAGQGQQPPEGVTLPVALSKVQPPYTDEAKQARIQGTVELVATVRDDGTPKFERITRGLGHGLDEAAAAAIEQWKFAPGTKSGQPVAVTITVLFHFMLK